MSKPIYILGTGLSHDGSSCLMQNGKILVAIEKERLTKKKHDGFNDNLTIKYCLDAANIGFQDLTLVVEENTTNEILKPWEKEKRGERIIPENIPRVTISHHLAHAYSVVGMSPFDEMGIIIMDGQGSSLDTCIDISNSNVLPLDIQNLQNNKRPLYWEKESYYAFKGGKLKTIFKDFSKFHIWDKKIYPLAPNDMEHSIAEFYGGISNYIFDDEYCEGKLMGLTPYGRPGIYSFEAFEYKDKRVFLKHDWMKNFDHYKGGRYQSFYEYFQYYADLAYWAQKQIEKATSYIFESYFKLFNHHNVGFAGGLALNAVSNTKLLQSNFRNLYIHPSPADNGLSIGCCYYGWLEILKKNRIKHNHSISFGKKYSRKELSLVISQYKSKIEALKTTEYIKKTADLLADGHVIGWFQSGSEFGPRALGYRSILSDPRKKHIRNFINRKIKSREDFRPFAPSVLLEDVSTYFNCDYASPYMILIANIKEEWREKVPAIVHKDGSCRIQTVTENMNLSYFHLIKEFKKLTGISLILNTSFNGRDMPIVETAEDAIGFFLKSSIDFLVINDRILYKKNDLQ